MKRNQRICQLARRADEGDTGLASQGTQIQIIPAEIDNHLQAPEECIQADAEVLFAAIATSYLSRILCSDSVVSERLRSGLLPEIDGMPRVRLERELAPSGQQLQGSPTRGGENYPSVGMISPKTSTRSGRASGHASRTCGTPARVVTKDKRFKYRSASVSTSLSAG